MNNKRRLAISIIKLFEELLYKHDMEIPSREKMENEARLYGSEYYELEDNITKLLEKGEQND